MMQQKVKLLLDQSVTTQHSHPENGWEEQTLDGEKGGQLTVGVVKDAWPIRQELETDMLRPSPVPASSMAATDGWRWQEREEEEEEEGEEEWEA